MDVTEYGVWSDEAAGFIETGLWTPAEAKIAWLHHSADDETARVRKICPDHEEQPANECEECLS